MGGAAAVGERFAAGADLDLVATARAFYQGHPDAYDQLVFWTDTGVVTSDTFAFETTVANAIQGIGTEIFDGSRDTGSGGQLSSLVLDGRPFQVPGLPTPRRGCRRSARTPLSRCWATRAGTAGWPPSPSRTRAVPRRTSSWGDNAPIGASSSTPTRRSWKASDLQDLGGGVVPGPRRRRRATRCSTSTPWARPTPRRRRRLGRGASGLSQDRESAPRTGVTFSGRRHDSSRSGHRGGHGIASPPPPARPRVLHRQAFVYVVSRGRTADPAAVSKLERFRAAWSRSSRPRPAAA